MVRLTTISRKIGLAAFAAALPLSQMPAMADDQRIEKVETPPPPIEEKTVRVILLPPANHAVFAFKPPKGAKPAAPTAEQPKADPAVVTLPQEPAKIDAEAAFAAPVILAPSATVPKQPQQEALIIPERPRQEATIIPKQPQQAVLQPPARNAVTAQPRPEPAKIRKPATVAAIPSLPERPPFRPVFDTIKPSELARSAAQTSREQPRESTSFLAKVNASFRPLTNLWSGNQRASETASPAAESSPRPVASQAAASESSEAPKPEKSSFLKKLRFWER
jgi:hypothetical protein